MNIRILSPIIWITLFLSVIEVGLEYRASSRGFSTILFQGKKATGASQTATNSFGPTPTFPFRSRILLAERKSGRRRIWIASASHAEDIHVPVEKIFPVRLEQSLKDRGISAEVMNASHAGIKIDDNTNDLDAHAKTWSPDVAILYQMSMDISKFSQLAASDVDESGAPNAPENNSSSLSWPSRLVENTTLYSLTKTNLTSRLTEQRLLPDELPKSYLTDFEKSVANFVSCSRQHGITPVLCTFAVSSSVVDDLSDDHWYGILKSTPNLSRTGWFATIKECNLMIRHVANRENVQLIELGPAMTGRQKCFRDFVHFSPKGHQVVADLISEALIQDSILNENSQELPVQL